MSDARDYLALPRSYARWLGGLRWSAGCDTIDYPDGTTFAFGRELARFVEGYGSHGPLPDFAHVVHAFHLFTRGPLVPGVDLGELPAQYRAAGSPLRNAGALAAELCRGLAPAEDAPNASEVALRLTRGPVDHDPDAWRVYPEVVTTAEEDTIDVEELSAGQGEGFSGSAWYEWPVLREPALEPAEFEARFSRALRRLSRDARKHWLRYGRGPTPAGDEAAKAVEAVRPPSLGEAFESALSRPRLAGARGLVDRLVGALALPPRRLDDERLPTGGYTDVATRGSLHHILPGQLALDPEEFLRRFAEGELLFYHREEPHAPRTEELGVVLDQGVRTWGTVRIVLAAAAAALGRLASQRGLPYRLWATSAEGGPLVPDATPQERWGEVLEACDFGGSPARALSEALAAEPAGRRRDLIVLTHPRALLDPALRRASEGIRAGTRVFSLSVDDRGRARFAQWRQGSTVPLVEFRVEVTHPTPPLAPVAAGEKAAGGWRGHVEPIGFPFRCWPIDLGGPDERFEFDRAGRHVLVAGADGMLYLFPTEGGWPEVLPRPVFDGELLRDPCAVVDRARGFTLVYARHRPTLVLAQYDLGARQVSVLTTTIPSAARTEWFSTIEPDRLVCRQGGRCWIFRQQGEHLVEAGETYTPWETELVAWTLNRPMMPPWLGVQHGGEAKRPLEGWVRLQPETGTLDGIEWNWPPFAPEADGQPMLRHCRIEQAQWRGSVLALAVTGGGRPPRFLLFRGPSDPLPEIERRGTPWPAFRLSFDGSRMALRTPGTLEIRSTANGTCRPYRPREPRPTIKAALGRHWVAFRDSTKHSHLLRWDGGELVSDYASTASFSEFLAWLRNRPGLSPLIGASASGDLPGAVGYDPRRFVEVCRGAELVAVVDRVGQVSLLDTRGQMLLMLAARGTQLAAWAPGPLALGPTDLLVGPETVEARRKIAQRLGEVTRAGRVGAVP